MSEMNAEDMANFILGLGSLGAMIAIVIASILLFFLPFYVYGIYNRVIKCQKELEEINQSIRFLGSRNREL